MKTKIRSLVAATILTATTSTSLVIAFDSHDATSNTNDNSEERRHTLSNVHGHLAHHHHKGSEKRELLSISRSSGSSEDGSLKEAQQRYNLRLLKRTHKKNDHIAENTRSDSDNDNGISNNKNDRKESSKRGGRRGEGPAAVVHEEIVAETTFFPTETPGNNNDDEAIMSDIQARTEGIQKYISDMEQRLQAATGNDGGASVIGQIVLPQKATSDIVDAAVEPQKMDLKEDIEKVFEQKINNNKNGNDKWGGGTDNKSGGSTGQHQWQTKSPSTTTWSPSTWNDDDGWWGGPDWSKGKSGSEWHTKSDKEKKGTKSKKSSSSWDDGHPPSWDSPPSSSSGGWLWHGTSSSKSGKHEKSGSKSRKWGDGPWQSVCTKRLHIAYDLMQPFSNLFGPIDKPSDVTALCSFAPPTSSNEYNLGCPFIYLPADVPPGLGFVSGKSEYQMVFGPDQGDAFNAFALYCECYEGYDLGCAGRIPHGPPTSEHVYGMNKVAHVNSYSEFIPYSTPSVRAEYCEMAGVWNGDIYSDVYHEFSEDVKECGCFWIGTAKDMVGTCPGVELGAFFPRGGNTPKALPFYSVTNPGTFPQAPWSVTEANGKTWEPSSEESYPGSNEVPPGTGAIVSPDLTNQAETNYKVNITLTVDPEWGPGKLSIGIFQELNYPADALLLFINDVRVTGWTVDDPGVWQTYSHSLGSNAKTITFQYEYNPVDAPGPVGKVYLDGAYFTPDSNNM